MSDTQLDAWVAALALALDVDPGSVDVPGLLDVAREAAHSVTRPAAPLATFMVGYAAAMRGGGPDAVAGACATVTEAAKLWLEEMPG